MQHALSDQQAPGRTRQPSEARRKQSKEELFTLIRRDSRDLRLSARALADRHGTGERTVRQALRSPRPAPRKPLPPRGSRLDQFTAIIDGMLQDEIGSYPLPRRSITSIYHELAAIDGADQVSYQMVRKYVTGHRTAIRQKPLPPAHQAIADHDLERLRELLDGGHDIKDDNGSGWSLLRRAVHAEQARHVTTGESLHADMTAFLLARGASHHEDAISATAEAELLGHWLAAEIITAWAKRAEITETETTTGWIQ